MIDRGHFALAAALCAAAGVGLAGWLRATDPPPRSQDETFADVTFGVRMFYELQGDHVEYLAPTTRAGNLVYATVKTANMPVALRVKVPVREGLQVIDVIPLRNGLTGP